jgi:hypothetical protein
MPNIGPDKVGIVTISHDPDIFDIVGEEFLKPHPVCDAIFPRSKGMSGKASDSNYARFLSIGT